MAQCGISSPMGILFNLERYGVFFLVPLRIYRISLKGRGRGDGGGGGGEGKMREWVGKCKLEWPARLIVRSFF